MALLAATGPGRVAPRGVDASYVPGVCNIGPAEIARRQRSGITASIATVVLFAVLVAVHAPVLARLVVFVPAAVAAAGFLQARLRFCAGFGWLGVFNFGDVGTTDHVAEVAARARDRRLAVRIAVASGIAGAVVGVAAVVLPV